MIGIGNDIVDLCECEPPLHERFCQRVFSPAERRNFGDSRQLMWLSWAVKEAAFKAIRRSMPLIRFIPRDFEFDIHRAEVKARGLVFDCKWVLESQYVYASCVNRDGAHPVAALIDWVENAADTGEQALYQQSSSPSDFVRRLAKRQIAAELRVSQCSIDLSSSSRSELGVAPRLYLRGRQSSHLLSFTHHGRFAACAFLRQ